VHDWIRGAGVPDSLINTVGRVSRDDFSVEFIRKCAYARTKSCRRSKGVERRQLFAQGSTVVDRTVGGGVAVYRKSTQRSVCVEQSVQSKLGDAVKNTSAVGRTASAGVDGDLTLTGGRRRGS
jgi:hypothetical protein